MNTARAVVFDTDGVLLATASLHSAAWKKTFDRCLPGWSGDRERRRPFDARRDYRELVDGRSRLDGVRAFLASRGIDLPAGADGDAPGCGTVRAVAASKDLAFTRAVAAGGVLSFPDVRPVLTGLRTSGIRCAAVSASRHARGLLEAADLLGLLDAVVDGTDASALLLPGKPDPALFSTAATRLRAEPWQTAVVEDAVAGVEAGRRGHFRPVVGLNRPEDPEQSRSLRAHGADLVLPALTGLPELLTGGPE